MCRYVDVTRPRSTIRLGQYIKKRQLRSHIETGAQHYFTLRNIQLLAVQFVALKVIEIVFGGRESLFIFLSQCKGRKKIDIVRIQYGFFLIKT